MSVSKNIYLFESVQLNSKLKATVRFNTNSQLWIVLDPHKKGLLSFSLNKKAKIKVSKFLEALKAVTKVI